MVTVKLVLVALPKVFDGVTVVAYIQVLTVLIPLSIWGGRARG
jgi:hypothetical protein